MTGSQCLYEVLGVEKNATQAEVKKAYRQRALQLHPDKNPDNEEAKAKFQLLQKVYVILGDEGKRQLYDQTGITEDDDLAGAGFDGLVDYFRAMFGIKTDDIDDFTANYQGSSEERADLLRYYGSFRGRMADVFTHLMCSDADADSHRLMDIIEQAIAAGEVQRFKPFTAWAKQVAAKPRPPPRSNRPASGAGASGSGGGGGGVGGGPSNALVAAIQAKRAVAANSFFDSLAEKYGGGGKGAGGGGKAKGGKAKDEGEPFSEPTEEEFEALQQRLLSNKAAGGGGKGGKKAGKDSAAAVAASGKRGRVVIVDDEEDDDVEEINADADSDVSTESSEEEEEAPRGKKKKKKAVAAAAKAMGKGKEDTARRGSDQVGSGGSGGGGGGAGKPPLKAKAAAGQEAAVGDVKDRAKGKGAARPRAEQQDKAKVERRAEEKENEAGGEAAAAGGKGKSSKGKEKRRQEQGGQPSKKAKRMAA